MRPRASGASGSASSVCTRSARALHRRTQREHVQYPLRFGNQKVEILAKRSAWNPGPTQDTSGHFRGLCRVSGEAPPPPPACGPVRPRVSPVAFPCKCGAPSATRGPAWPGCRAKGLPGCVDRPPHGWRAGYGGLMRLGLMVRQARPALRAAAWPGPAPAGRSIKIITCHFDTLTPSLPFIRQ